jgi:RNA polymerase sigma factor (TIGR02999 family)
MSPASGDELSGVLQAAQDGDPRAAAQLLPLVYADLRRLARARLARQAPGQTLQPTALVHEAYLRIAGQGDVTWQGRRHFFFAAARAMRDILVEQARRKAAARHGGGRGREELDEADLVLEEPAADMLVLHEALGELEQQDPLKAQIVMLRYFSGLTMAETAEVLGQSERTLHRHWRYIKAWLKMKLAGDDAEGE